MLFVVLDMCIKILARIFIFMNSQTASLQSKFLRILRMYNFPLSMQVALAVITLSRIRLLLLCDHVAVSVTCEVSLIREHSICVFH